jgi:hypothetical protein
MFGKGFLTDDSLREVTCYEQFNPLSGQSKVETLEKVFEVLLEALFYLSEKN